MCEDTRRPLILSSQLRYFPDSYAALEYSLRTDSDLGSDATPTLQVFYYFARSLEENMDATRKAVVAVALAEDQAIQYK